jgi:ribosomal protein S18 acetylase RimI-like enzyme
MAEELEFTKVEHENDLPSWLSREDLVNFLHEKMKPYQDTTVDVDRAMDYVFDKTKYSGGFTMLAHYGERLAGACVMPRSGMTGYIPENVLLFVCIDPDLRGRGLGRKLIERSIEECEGNVKLHVEYDNPAKRLYERIGFTNKYAEMRYEKK